MADGKVDFERAFAGALFQDPASSCARPSRAA